MGNGPTRTHPWAPNVTGNSNSPGVAADAGTVRQLSIVPMRLMPGVAATVVVCPLATGAMVALAPFGADRTTLNDPGTVFPPDVSLNTSVVAPSGIPSTEWPVTCGPKTRSAMTVTS